MTIPSTEMQKQRYSRELAAYTLMQWDKAHLPADRPRKSEAPQKILRHNSNNNESHIPSRRTSECRPPGTLLCHISHASKGSLITIDRLEKIAFTSGRRSEKNPITYIVRRIPARLFSFRV